MKNTNVVTILIIAVVVSAASFFSGIQYQKSQSSNFTNGQFGQGGQGQRGNGQQRTGGARGGFGGANVGEIVSLDANSITLKLQDGSSKIINLSDKTTISKTDTASKSDLKTGERIAAIGTANSDGSIDAQNIQLNPLFRTGQNRPSPTQ